MELGVGLAHKFLQLLGMNRIGHPNIAIQHIQSATGIDGCHGLGQGAIVIPCGVSVADFLFQTDGLAQGFHGFFIASDVNEVPTFVLQGNCQLIAVQWLLSPHDDDGRVCHLQPQGIFAFAVIGIAQLRHVVGHSRQEVYGTCCLHGSLTIFDGLIHLQRTAEYLAGHTQCVVQLHIVTHLLIGLDGFDDQRLGLIVFAQGVIDQR